MRGGQHPGSRNNSSNNSSSQPHSNNAAGSTKLNIRGWTNSSAASNPDGGIHSLHGWLEKRASRKIIKSFKQDDSFVIIVNTNDVHRFTHLNGFTFANAIITVEETTNQEGITPFPSGPRNQQSSHNQHVLNSNNHSANHPNNYQPRGSSRGAHQINQRKSDLMQISGDAGHNVEEALIAVIKRCYEPGSKFLNLQKLPEQSEIQAIGLTSQPAAKVFAALFVCCETKVFETPAKRQQMVESLSLAANGLTTVKDCIGAASTFGHIKNLDLGNNAITDVGELRYWRNKFPNLEHLILRNNPCDGPETRRKMKQWYPKLSMYNGEPIPNVNEPIPASTPTPTPQVTNTALELLSNEPHPEVPQGSTYGQPAPGKPGDQVMKEQMALRFSYETKLKLQLSEECLVQNQFDFTKAVENLRSLMSQGQIQDSFLLSPRPVN